MESCRSWDGESVKGTNQKRTGAGRGLFSTVLRIKEVVGQPVFNSGFIQIAVDLHRDPQSCQSLMRKRKRKRKRRRRRRTSEVGCSGHTHASESCRKVLALSHEGEDVLVLALTSAKVPRRGSRKLAYCSRKFRVRVAS